MEQVNFACHVKAQVCAVMQWRIEQPLKRKDCREEHNVLKNGATPQKKKREQTVM